MDTIHALRLLHYSAGAVGLLLGPIVMLARKITGLHTRAGEIYFIAVTVVCASAVILALLRWAEFAFFLPVALGTYAIALPGYIAGKKRGRHWLLIHVIGLTSSYVAMISSFIVNNIRKVPGIPPLPFAVRALVPMFIGTCAVAWLAWQVHLGKRPKR